MIRVGFDPKNIYHSQKGVTYESGLANPNFNSGPTGSFSIIKGTYQQK